MLTLHDDIELTIGDEWEILGQLLQEDGTPLPLDPSVGIAWTLLDPDALAVADLVDFATLERLDPVANGNVMITIDAMLTKTFRPGRYTDALRVTVGSAPSMLWRGLILAGADPFYLEVTP